MAAWSQAIHHLALQVGLDDPVPDHQLEISRAQELLKENSWATRQNSWHRRQAAAWPRSSDPMISLSPIWGRDLSPARGIWNHMKEMFLQTERPSSKG
jgi:hypothetical protein